MFLNAITRSIAVPISSLSSKQYGNIFLRHRHRRRYCRPSSYPQRLTYYVQQQQQRKLTQKGGDYNQNGDNKPTTSGISDDDTTSSSNDNDKTKHNGTNNNIDGVPTELTDALNALGYTDKAVIKGMLDAIAMVYGGSISTLNKSKLDSFGTEGLSALAHSVEKEIGPASSQNRNFFIGTIHITVPHHNTSFSLSLPSGRNVMHLATQTLEGRELLGEYLECACQGTVSCATCHVIVDEKTYNKMEPPTEAECDMLDLAYEPTETSRLGCQIVMTPEVDGMTLTIPSGVNNFWS